MKKKRNCFFFKFFCWAVEYLNQLLPVVIYRFWALVFNLTRPMDGWIYAICLACPFYTICVSMSILLFRSWIWKQMLLDVSSLVRILLLHTKKMGGVCVGHPTSHTKAQDDGPILLVTNSEIKDEWIEMN